MAEMHSNEKSNRSKTSTKMQPKNCEIIGFYSIRPDGTYVCDSSQLKFIRTVPRNEIPFDLNEKFVKAGRFSEEIAFLHLLHFLKDNETILNSDRQKNFTEAPFVCTKGTLLHLCQPGNLKISTCLCNNVIYLSADKFSPHLTGKNLALSEEAGAWGLKFQQFMQSELPDGEPDTEKLAYGIERFKCMFKTSINNHNIIYTGSVDGVKPNGKFSLKNHNLDQSKMVEVLNGMELVDIHTTLHRKSARQMNSFRKFKTQKFWLQAYFAGINKIVLGYRDESGILRNIDETTIDGLVKQSENFWSSKTLLESCENILNIIKKAYIDKVLQKCLKKEATSIAALPKIEIYFRQVGEVFLQVPATEAKEFPVLQINKLV